MALSQMLYSLGNKHILESSELINEKELEDILCENIDLLDSNWLVIGRQVITRNGKVLDILCIDRGYKLIVVELKKSLTPREVTAQIIEYASYIAEMKIEDLKNIYEAYMDKYTNKKSSLNDDFRTKFGSELDETQIDYIPKMVIVAAKMDDGTEHIIKYLSETYDVDINILFFQVFKNGNDRIMSRVWFKDNADIEIKSEYRGYWNREYYISFGDGSNRMWDDAQKYGFISAGGGKWYTQTLKMLHSGDRIWVNIPHRGYVGVGIVNADVQQASEAGWEINGIYTLMKDMDLSGTYFYSENDYEQAEFVVPVKWIKTVSVNEAIKEMEFFGNQNTVCRPTSSKWNYTLTTLKKYWNIID